MKSQWESATGKNTKDAYSDFLKQYPDGEYKNEALQKIESLDYQEAKNMGTIKFYVEFINKYPNSEYKNEALQKIESLDYQEAKNTDTIEIYDEFISKYPNSKFVSNAQQNIERLYLVYFENSKSSKDPKELELYISKYPKSKYRSEAAIILENLIYSNAIKDKSISSCEIYINRYSNGKYINEVKKIYKPLIRKEQTISFVDNFSKIMQDYLVNQKPINVINDTKSILSQYEFADDQVRNLAIKYLRPFHELSLIDDKLKSESSLWTSLKDKYLTGRARDLELKIDEINDMFVEYKMEAGNVQKYLTNEYNIDLKMTEWNFKVLVKK